MSRIVRALLVVTLPTVLLPTLVSAQDSRGPTKAPLPAFDRPFIVPEMTELPKGLKPFEYKDVGDQIPNYKGNKFGKKGATLNLLQVSVPAEESLKHMVTPKGLKVELAIMLYSPNGKVAAKMPKSVSLVCNTPAKAIHLLGGVSAWGYPSGEKGTVSAIVRLHYEDGKTEDHVLKNGEHFADYLGKSEVPGSKLAFDFKGRQRAGSFAS